MKSLTQLYRIGRGPSSSHTIGPQKIAEYALKQFPEADGFRVILYGSLALTGKGHGTDRVLRETLPFCEVVYDAENRDIPHPNTMDIYALKGGKDTHKLRGISVGGGEIRIEGAPFLPPAEVYSLNSFAKIKAYVIQKDIRLSEYVFETEPQIYEYLQGIWKAMQSCVERGLSKEGELPGGLHIRRKARRLYEQKHPRGESTETRQAREMFAYAFAVAEENADNGVVVTAPTCGAAAVLPAALYYLKEKENFTEDDIIRALATAGIIGNVVKTNASISGAECGCQAEIGTACSMTAAAVCELYNLDVSQIECAAEVAMEHNLGLTCDPVAGLVQVPCIERNAMAVLRALDCFRLAYYLTDMRKISFDTIVETMYQTGQDLNSRYRETAEGGIATHYKK